MRDFVAFLKKEMLECLRSGKLLILGALFLGFGIMNPAVAKMTPWLLELMAEEMAESGMTVTAVTVDALTSWTQFYKNIPMALIAFVLLTGSSFTKEYESDTLILLLTKGLSRTKVLAAKAAVLTALWSAGYWLCFAVTYGYNAYFWDNGIAKSLAFAALCYWLFGVLVVALTVFFSTLLRGYGTVLLAVGSSTLALYLLGLLPSLKHLLPLALTDGMSLLAGAKAPGDLLPAVLFTAALILALLAASIPVFRKKGI